MHYIFCGGKPQRDTKILTGVFGYYNSFQWVGWKQIHNTWCFLYGLFPMWTNHLLCEFMQTETALKNEPLQDNRHSQSHFFLHSSRGPVSRVNGYPWLCHIRMRKIPCSAVAEWNSISFLTQHSHDKRTHWTQVSQTSLTPALFWLHSENDSAKNVKDSLTTTVCCCITAVPYTSRIHLVWAEAQRFSCSAGFDKEIQTPEVSPHQESCRGNPLQSYSSIEGCLQFHL